MEKQKAYESFGEYYTDIIDLVDILLESETNTQEMKKTYFLKLEQINERIKLSIEDGLIIPLEYIFHVYQLNEFERHCVRLALVPELNRKYELKYQSFQGSSALTYPTVDFCIQNFAMDMEETITLLGVFRERKKIFHNLFTVEEEKVKQRGTLSIQLKLKEGILDFIFGNGSLSWQLGEEAEIRYPEDDSTDTFLLYDTIAPDIMKFMNKKEEKVLFYIYGESGTGKRTLVTHCLKELGYPFILVDVLKIINSNLDFVRIVHNIAAEAILRQADLCFYHVEAIQKEENKFLFESMIPIILEVSQEVFLLSEVDWNLNDKSNTIEFIKYKLKLPEYKERVQLWNGFLEKETKEEDLCISTLAEHFCFNPEQIKTSIEQAKKIAEEKNSLITKEILWKCAQEQIRYSFEENVTHIESLYSFDELILPPKQMQMLKRVCARMEYKRQVYKEWGFDKKLLYGKGISMLFCGPPGTGKTMSAGVIAKELHMELYKVDLSMITSKYIGETEKNLKKIFQEGKKGPVILFFDEADALFGKRSEVKDAHDKYANFETSYLLQMMEEYEGVVILATNFIKNFDEAFKRRIKFIVDFPFPEKEERLSMWKTAIPKDCPIKGEIDYFFLAEHFQLSGSSIKDITLSAAFLAAQNKEELDMTYLLKMIEEEMRKKGEILTKNDLGEYYFLMK